MHLTKIRAGISLETLPRFIDVPVTKPAPKTMAIHGFKWGPFYKRPKIHGFAWGLGSFHPWRWSYDPYNPSYNWIQGPPCTCRPVFFGFCGRFPSETNVREIKGYEIADLINLDLLYHGKSPCGKYSFLQPP